MDPADFKLKFNLHTFPAPPAVLPRADLNEPLRRAAVLVALQVKQGQLVLILTRRARHLRQHPGQISFPGGKVDKSDLNITATALREAHEEIGLASAGVEPLGLLDQHATLTGFNITPIVSLITAPFTPRVDSGEVDELLTVPLSFLLDPAHRHVHYVRRKNRHYPVYFIVYQQYFIWGATAAIIEQLCQLIAPTRLG